MKYSSTKTYGHERGLSCNFRQWRADSHCRWLHGYSLSIHLEFSANTLDERNWVIDFGSLKPVKEWLEHMFDHTLLVAHDDPMLLNLTALDEDDLADIRVVRATGCEAFAEMVACHVQEWLATEGHTPRVALTKVEVKEHNSNGAIWRPE